jgi:hypothetical protein
LLQTSLKRVETAGTEDVEVDDGGHPVGAIDVEVAKIASEAVMGPEGLAAADAVPDVSIIDLDWAGESEV